MQRDTTAVTRYQVDDSERTLIFNVAQQFIDAQLAQSVLTCVKDLKSFEETVRSAKTISSGRHHVKRSAEDPVATAAIPDDVAGAEWRRSPATLRQFLGLTQSATMNGR